MPILRAIISAVTPSFDLISKLRVRKFRVICQKGYEENGGYGEEHVTKLVFEIVTLS